MPRLRDRSGRATEVQVPRRADIGQYLWRSAPPKARKLLPMRPVRAMANNLRGSLCFYMMSPRGHGSAQTSNLTPLDSRRRGYKPLPTISLRANINLFLYPCMAKLLLYVKLPLPPPSLSLKCCGESKRQANCKRVLWPDPLSFFPIWRQKSSKLATISPHVCLFDPLTWHPFANG